MAEYRSTATVPIEYHELIIDLQDELKKSNVISRVEYVGSAYKGTSVPGSDFDNLFVKKVDTVTACPSANYADHAVLRTDGRYGSIVEPNLQRNDLKGSIQRALNSMGLAEKCKLSDSGPAIAISCYSSSWRMGGSPLFSADIDLCYDVKTTRGVCKMYIAKPPRGASGDDQYAWKLTTDLEEKAKISIIDTGNGIGRWAVRILKALKNQESTLKIFKSSMFEQVLYHLKDEHRDKKFWLESNLLAVIQAMLKYVAAAVRRGMLKHYMMSENMLPSMNSATKENVLNRLDRLAQNPQRVLDMV